MTCWESFLTALPPLLGPLISDAEVLSCGAERLFEFTKGVRDLSLFISDVANLFMNVKSSILRMLSSNCKEVAEMEAGRQSAL